MPIPELRMSFPIGKVETPHLAEIECRGRTSHVHWDGAEVQRLFYVNHYKAAPEVCEGLLGFVLRDGNKYRRFLPASDPYYDQILYCNEARWDHVDGDKKSISNSPAIGTPGRVPTLAAYHYYLGRDTVKGKLNTVAELAEGGAFITATYRPMISGYTGLYGVLDAAGRDRQFDFMSPTLTSGTQTVPWPDGFEILKRFNIGGLANADEVSADVVDPYTIPLIEFSIRRMFLGKVPYRTFDRMLNRVNHEAWPPGQPNADQWPYSIPQFPAETLRFDSYEETRHWSQSSEKNKWHEVKLNFSWRNHYSLDVHHLDTALLLEGEQPVTWNHIFINPFGADLGWYPIFRNRNTHTTKLYFLGNFDTLFGTVTPSDQ